MLKAFHHGMKGFRHGMKGFQVALNALEVALDLIQQGLKVFQVAPNPHAECQAFCLHLAIWPFGDLAIYKWICPVMYVTAWPPMETRSPLSMQYSVPPRGERCRATSVSLPSFLDQ